MTETNNNSKTRSCLPSTLIRSLALFFGLFAIANAVGFMLGNAEIESVWWVDFRIQILPNMLKNLLALIIQLACGSALVLWGLRPLNQRNDIFAGVSSIIILLFALKDAISYWALLDRVTLIRVAFFQNS